MPKTSGTPAGATVRTDDSALSHLETSEISEHALSRGHDAEAGLGSLREKLIERLDSEGRNDLSAPLERCGRQIGLTCLACLMTHSGEERCKRRYCPVCSRMIAARLVKRYESTCGSVKWPLFVSWTAMHTELFPLEGFRPLFDAFKKLRRQKWFADKVRGGIVSGEVSWGGNGSWHYHLHSILDCRWLSVTTPAPPPGCDKQLLRRRGLASQREVRAQWEMALGRSGSLKAQRISGPGAIQEVLKYAVTAESLLSSTLPVGPVIDRIQESRLVRGWGCMYGRLKDAENLAPKQKAQCPTCGVRAAKVPERVVQFMVPRSTVKSTGRAYL